MTRWEYHIITLKWYDENLDQTLDDLGEKGWEMVNALETNEDMTFTMFFKRPRGYGQGSSGQGFR